jgi:hypothetical protein
MDQALADIPSERRGFAYFQENLAQSTADTFENSMNTALNNLATGAYDKLEDVFGQIALDFGNMLLQEINRAIAADLARSILGDGFGGSIGGFISKGLGAFGGFLKGLIPGFATGGYINTGSGVKDDVPAMLMGGEYVVRKAAVQKYGVDFLESLNQGQVQGYAAGGAVQGGTNYYETGSFWKDPKGNMMGGAASNARLARAKQTEFFMPGYRGAGAIVGKENLLAFAMQEGTSGSTDTFSRRGGTGFSFDTELQSSNLSALGRIRMRQSPLGQSLMQSKQQAFDLYVQRVGEEQRVFDIKKQAEQARSEQFKSAVVGAAVGSIFAGFAAGIGDATKAGGSASNGVFNDPIVVANGGPFRGMRNFANGGNANAMLMGGEYVMSPQASSSIGRTMLDDINNMRYPMPNFANGGANGSAPIKSGSSSGSADIGELNITINMEKGGKASVESSSMGAEGEDPRQQREFAKKIKDAVIQVIQEEKRVSGSLYTRNK